MNVKKISPAHLAAGDILCDDAGKPFAILTVKDTHGTDNPRAMWDTVSYPDMGPYLCIDFPDGTDALIADVPRITPDMTGTWLSGHMGWHNGYRVVMRAEKYGFTVPEEYATDWREFLRTWRSENGPDRDWWDTVHGDDGAILDRATEFLELRAPEGHTFVWDAGELSLMSEADADEFGHFG